MKIYVGHSREYDYVHNLYEPLLNSNIAKEHEFVFPHYNNKEANSKDIVEESDLFIAEVSFASTGLGIEIGRAESKNKKILCVYDEQYKCPSSLKFVNVDVISYKNVTDLMVKLEEYIKKLEK